MSLLSMFFAFFKIGLFTIGGGLVAIPIMQNYVLEYNWIDKGAFVDMIAISQTTPGSIGINVATFIGFVKFGIIGSVVITLGMVLPSLIITSIIARLVHYSRDNKWSMALLKGIRPAALGAIGAASFFIAEVSVLTLDRYSETRQLMDMFNVKSLIMFLIIFISMFKIKIHPIAYIVIGGVLGVAIF